MFSKPISKTLLTAALTGLLLASPLSAATFTFMAEVTTTTGPSATPGVPSLPPSGTLGTVELEIDDSDPSLVIIDGGSGLASLFATASVTVPGWIAGSMQNNPDPSDFLDISATSFAFGAYGPTSVVTGNGAPILPNARHSFRVFYGVPVLSTPTTVGDLVAALSAPGASGFFSHELEVGGSGFVHTRVEFPASTPAIPLPASGWLILAGVAGLGLLRKTSRA